MTASTAAFDALDETFQADPIPVLSALRERHAVFRDAVLPAVHVLRYDDVHGVLLDSENFTNDYAWAIQPYLESMPDVAEELPPLFLATDGDEHRRLRSLANKAFSRGSVLQMEGHVQRLTESLMAKALRQGDVDFIDAVAYPLPVQVIAEMLGVPVADHEWFKDWSSRFVGGFGSAVFEVPEPEVVDAQVETFREMHAYLRPLVEQRRRVPQEDLLSRLASAEEDGDRLTMPELMQMVGGLLVAGHETTTNLLANIVVELCRHPNELARLRADRTLIPSAIEEVIRFAGPTFALMRIAARDTEIAGVEVGEDEMAILWMSSAHRDPAVFDNPDTFDIGRTPNPHLGFSKGSHFCLGAPLARLEARIVLEQLLDSTASFEMLTNQPCPAASPIVRGYAELPMRLKSRP